MLRLALFVFAWGLAASELQLLESSFLRLPAKNDRYGINLGTADAITYDNIEELIYVVGTRADVLHVIDYREHGNPQRLFTHEFDEIFDGVPLDVSFCRKDGEEATGRWAISFASRTPTQAGHVQIFDPLTRSDLDVNPRFTVAVGSDPKSIQWDTTSCNKLVVASEGLPGNFGGSFTNPKGYVDFVEIAAGDAVSRTEIDFSRVPASQFRHVYKDTDLPDDGLLNDIEPENVAIYGNDVYVTLEENNAMAKFDLLTPALNPPQVTYLGLKNWNLYDIDTSPNDVAISPEGDGVNLKKRNVFSFYQPSDVDVFEFNGVPYLLTADSGAVKRYTSADHGIDWVEAVQARTLAPLFGDGIDEDTRNDFTNNAEMGVLEVSQLRQPSDGWDTTFGHFDFLVHYGGRSWSIWRTTDMSLMYDSGGDLEYRASNSSYRSVFNADVTSHGLTPPATFDSRSDNKGPEVQCVAHTKFLDKDVVVVASGRNGVLFVYELVEITGQPSPVFQSVFRSGDTNAVWNQLYSEDRCGVPFIKDMLITEHHGHTEVMVVGSRMGAIAVYELIDA